MRDAHHFAHPLYLNIEVGMAEKAANECGSFIPPGFEALLGHVNWLNAERSH
jgi:hypothetical protein